MGSPVDVAKLAAVLETTRESGDLAARIKVAEGEIREAQAAIERQLRLLKPQVAEAEALGSMSVPPREMVQHHRDACRDLEQRFMACGERLGSAEQDLARQLKAYERITRREHAVSPEELAQVRQHRDSCSFCNPDHSFSI